MYETKIETKTTRKLCAYRQIIGTQYVDFSEEVLRETILRTDARVKNLPKLNQSGEPELLVCHLWNINYTKK